MDNSLFNAKGRGQRYRLLLRANAEKWLRLKTRPLIMPSSTQGMSIDRKVRLDRSPTVHALGEKPTAGERLQSAAAGQAFSWWSSMTPAEKDAYIARIMKKNAARHASGKQSGGRWKKADD